MGRLEKTKSNTAKVKYYAFIANKSAMFARKDMRAGTGFRAAPARPIYWRYKLRRFKVAQEEMSLV